MAASITQNLTTYYAKRIIGDAAAQGRTDTNSPLNTSGVSQALLQTGENVITSTWLLHRNNRNSIFGIKYAYDGTGDGDKIELYGGQTETENLITINKPTVWAQLNTGNIYIMGKVGIGYNPNTTNNNYSLYVNGTSYFDNNMYIKEKVGIGYNPNTAGNTYKLYVHGGQTFLNNTTASNNNLSSQLIVANTDGTGAAIELWRNGNASWQIMNDSGTLYIRNNWTTTKQSTYSQNSLIMDYNTGAASLPYLALGQTTRNTSYKLYVNGSTYFNIGTDSTSDLDFVINGSNAYLSFSGQGIKSFTSADANNTLFLNYNGGQTQIGGSSYLVGNVGIGYDPDTSGNTYKLYVNGTSFFNNISILKNGVYSHICNASGGTAGYFNFATIVISGAYVNRVVKIDYSGRGRIGGTMYIYVANSSETDPTLYVYYEGSPAIYYYKSATSTWQLYIQKEENYANDIFFMTIPGAVLDSTFSFTWQNTLVSTLPTGYSTATVHTKSLNISGKATLDGNGNTITSTYVNKAGDVMSGELDISSANCIRFTYGSIASTESSGTTNQGCLFRLDGSNFYLLNVNTDTRDGNGWYGNHPWYVSRANHHTYFYRAHNAVWNDFAEFREADIIEPGRVVVDTISGKMTLATKRLQAGAKIISDTYGCSVGLSDVAKTPIGVAGRVLAYTYQNRNNYPIGAAVCAAPNGTVDIMTREEIIQYPERIIGTVSEIPNYEYWENQLSNNNSETPIKNTVKVKVDGRIWIYVK